ncbi:unnamed protein product [Larinioides sclopetarius]|uniref:Uncharacterized protein n=1 Tax=Larinioides sclopetarius TaxID=280406 RepID=A0AAV2B4T7_9ARAC
MTPNIVEKFYQSDKPAKELVIRLGEKHYDEINIAMGHTDPKSRIPRSNPFVLQPYIKKHVTRHANISNLKFTRAGKIIFTTADPVCAAQILSLDKILETPVFSDPIWENITSLFDIPTQIPLCELAEELNINNEMVITQMRRFVKQDSIQESSPVLITTLGTALPDSIKIWFTKQKIQPFVDRPRQCAKCFSFHHPTKFCDKPHQLCHRCGMAHNGPCTGPEKCLNCQGSHAATSKECPCFAKEKKISDFKSRNHLTLGEARRMFNQAPKSNYVTVVKTSTNVEDFERNINQKLENIVKSYNERIEQQSTHLVNMLEKTVNNLIEKFNSVLHHVDKTDKSPNRKSRNRIKNSKTPDMPMQWDTGGPSGSRGS